MSLGSILGLSHIIFSFFSFVFFYPSRILPIIFTEIKFSFITRSEERKDWKIQSLLKQDIPLVQSLYYCLIMRHSKPYSHQFHNFTTWTQNDAWSSTQHRDITDIKSYKVAFTTFHLQVPYLISRSSHRFQHMLLNLISTSQIRLKNRYNFNFISKSLHQLLICMRSKIQNVFIRQIILVQAY